MTWLDKAKVFLGIIDEEDIEEDIEPRAQKRIRPTQRDGRPSLDGIEAAPQQSLDDALAAREAGDLDEMRKLLREMDRGGGLRTVLRAAAALEAGDEAELAPLLPIVRADKPAWKLPLQVAMSLRDSGRAEKLRARAEQAEAPTWALGWARALSSDEAERNRGLVELLFANVSLARTVAARDLKLPGAEADAAAAERYAAFAHGRSCIERFGAEQVADLLERAGGAS